jgi:hypothetical protein
MVTNHHYFYQRIIQGLPSGKFFGQKETNCKHFTPFCFQIVTFGEKK